MTTGIFKSTRRQSNLKTALKPSWAVTLSSSKGLRRCGLRAFTLPELLVLVGIGSILTGLLLPDLSQTRSKLLEQACVANLKQWGVGILLYAHDNGGWTYNNSNPFNASATNPHNPSVPGGYNPYWVGNAAGVQNIRSCPAVSAQPFFILGAVSYSFTWPNRPLIPSQLWGLASSPGVRLPGIPRPDEYALMMDSSAVNLTLSSAQLRNNTTNVLARHQGVINVLFADMHVGTADSTMIQTQATAGGSAGLASPWFASEHPPANSGVVIQYY